MIFLHRGFCISLALKSGGFLCGGFQGQIPLWLQTFLREAGASSAPLGWVGGLSPQSTEQGGDEQPVL